MRNRIRELESEHQIIHEVNQELKEKTEELSSKSSALHDIDFDKKIELQRLKAQLDILKSQKNELE